MSEIYTLAAKDLEKAYEALNIVANKIPDKPKEVTDALEPLTTSDTRTYFLKDLKLPEIPVTDGSGKRISLHDEPNLIKLHAELTRRDRDHDKKIDREFLRQDIEFVAVEDPATLPDWAGLGAMYENSVFTIDVAYMQDNSSKIATGFIVGKKPAENGEGHIYHVLTKASAVNDYKRSETDFALRSLGGAVEILGGVKLVNEDPETDTMLLEFTAPADLPVLELAGPEAVPAEGTPVFALGPARLEAKFKDREIGLNAHAGAGRFNYVYPWALQRIEPSVLAGQYFDFYSGTPVLQRDGKVLSFAFAASNPDTIWFTLPAKVLAESYARMTREPADGVVYGDWGLSVRTLGEDDLRRRQLPEALAYKGVFVSFVRPGGPAAAAGILPGDQILAVNGNEATATAQNDEELYRFLTAERNGHAEDPVKFTVYRITDESEPHKGRVFQLTVETAGRHAQAVAAYETAMGFSAVEITDSDRMILGLPEATAGVWVQSLKTKVNSEGKTVIDPSVANGLLGGMIITAVNGTPTPDVASFAAAWKAALEKGGYVRLQTTFSPENYVSTMGGIGAQSCCVLNLDEQE